jgi:hypothetical protein
MKEENIILGIFLVLLGFAFILWGDKKFNVKKGEVRALHPWSPAKAKWMKWPMGGLLLYAGVTFLYRAFS